jgi:hypothetical protein
MIPPPHPTRKTSANIDVLVLSMNCPFSAGIGTDGQIPLARNTAGPKNVKFQIAEL